METVLFELKGSVGVITLNRPKRMNALDGQLLQELSELLDKCEIDDNVRTLVLTGGKKFFSAGADIKYVNSLESEAEFTVFSRKTRELFHKIESFPKPVIAAVAGTVLGGGLEMALCADIRVVSDEAKFGLPEAKLGAIPGAGGTQRLPRLIGPALAKELIFTGRTIGADEAYRIGLVNSTASADTFLDRSIELANEISEQAPLAVQAAKNSINNGMQVDLESGLNYEAQCTAIVTKSEDHKEGFQSFVEKRKPVWIGR